MAEQRMSLEDAAKLLGGLHPNTVRARARTGKIPFEKDNSGKWWVFIDPDKAANDPARKATKPLPIEATLDPKILSGFRTLEVTIQVLNQELDAIRAERDKLRESADETTRLLAEQAAANARNSALKEEIADLRQRLDEAAARSDRDAEERRKLTDILIEQRLSPLPPVEAAPDSPQEARTGGFWSWLRRE